MVTTALTRDNFEQVVTGNDTVIVDFWAPWCGPCRAFAPTFEATSAKYPGIVFAKVNTEDEPELAGHFDIRSIPTLMVFREKVLLFSQPGALPGSALESIIKKVQEIDMAEVHRDIAAQEAAETGAPS
jgi:thioredoxin 1